MKYRVGPMRAFVSLASCAVLLGLAIPLAIAGCGSSNSSTSSDAGSGSDTGTVEDTGTTPTEAGSGDSAPSEASAGDGGVEAGPPPCTVPDGGAFPVGTQLVKSATVSGAGLTSDGYAVYVDSSSNKAYAVGIAGDAGAPVTIGAVDNSGMSVVGAAVLNWTGAVQTTGLGYGALSIWTSAHGVQSLATASLSPSNQVNGWFDVSKDGSSVLYFDNAVDVGSIGATADLYVANTDGTGKVALVKGVYITAQCVPQVGFVGAYAVASYCTSAPTVDAGTAQPIATISTWTGAGWATTVQAAGSAYGYWSADAAQTLVAYRNAAGFYAYTVATDSSKLVDTNGVSGVFTSDSTAIVYVTTKGTVSRATLAAPSPQVVLAAGDAGAGYMGLLALSPDDSYLVAYQNYDANSGYTDLYFSSTAAGSTATPLSSAQTAAIYGDAFTADSKYALYYANLNSSQVGDYDIASVTTPTPTKVAGNGWEGFATTAGKVVFTANWMAGAQGSSGRSDLQKLDTAVGTTASTVVSQVDSNFFLSSDKSQLVYSWSYCSNAQAGLYVTATP